MVVKRSRSRKARPKPAARKKPQARAPKKAPKPATPAPIDVAVEIRSSAGRVWDALTQPDQVNRWFTARCEFEARNGGRVLYYWSSAEPDRPPYVERSRYGTAAECRIEGWEPPRRLELRALAHWPGRVRFTLEPTATGCRVRVEHEGWPAKDDWYRMHVTGWTEMLERLKHFLEDSETVYDAYLARVKKP